MDNKIKPEQWLYVLFVITLPFPTLFQFRFLNVPLQLCDLVFLITAVVWAFAVIIRRAVLRWSWFYLVLAAYASAMVLSTIASDDPTQSSAKLIGKLYLIGIAFLTFNIVSSTTVLYRVLQGWLLAAGIAIVFSLAGIILFYLGFKDPSQNVVLHPVFGSLPSGNYPRIESFFLYPAMFCNFLGVTWMFALLAASADWIKARVFWWFGIGLLIVNAFTLTPGLGGIFLATGLFLRERIKGQKPLLARSVLAVSLLIGAAFFFAASVTLFSYSSKGSQIPLASGQVEPSHRARAWSTALETFMQHPILGRGVGMPVARSEFTDPSGNRQLLTDAHNTYLSTLGETGLLGFLSFMAIASLVTLSLFRWVPKGNTEMTIRLCLLLALADAFFYQSLTGSYEDTRHLWLLFGIATAVSHRSSFSDSIVNFPENDKEGRSSQR